MTDTPMQQPRMQPGPLERACGRCLTLSRRGSTVRSRRTPCVFLANSEYLQIIDAGKRCDRATPPRAVHGPAAMWRGTYVSKCRKCLTPSSSNNAAQQLESSVRHSFKIPAALVLAAIVSACGGGGGGGDPVEAVAPPVVTATPEGFWEGTSSSNVVVQLAILDSGETWGVYASNNAIVGALYGNTSSNGTHLTGSGRDFNIPSRTVAAGSYSGTYTAKSTINVTTSPGGVQFTGAYIPAYDQPASLAAVAGTFTGTGVSGTSPVQNVSVVVSTSGAITVPATLGCSASGTATPRPGGKNVLNLTITFSGTTCALGNGTSTTGVAYFEAATRRIIVMAMNPAKSDGFIYVGQK